MSTQAERVATFIESFLTLGHSHAGQPFKLMDFQREVLEDIYKTDAAGRRLRRTYLLGLARKNGKSQLGAALGLFHLIADKADASPQVISAAGDRAQARLVFDEARRMVLASPELAEVCEVLRGEIRCSLNGGTYRAVSADAGLQQGLNPSAVIFDELHVFKNAELYEALTLGSATRSQPLTVVISTAGYDPDTPLGRLYAYGLRVDGHRLNGTARRGEVDDEAFGMTWYGPEPGEDYEAGDPATWERFNPAWPIMNPEDFATAHATTHEAAFIRYRLNGWTTAQASFLPRGTWEALELPGRELEPKELVVLGFDGAWRGDSTALVAVSMDDFHTQVLGHWEAPEGDRHWRTPVAEVEDAIRLACEHFSVREVAADPYRFEQSLQALMAEGVPVVEFTTNSRQRMTLATQAFYDAVRAEDVTHDGSPALARHMANAVLKETPVGALVTKEHKSSKRHIDLAIAAIIAHYRARMWEAEESAPARADGLIQFL